MNLALGLWHELQWFKCYLKKILLESMKLYPYTKILSILEDTFYYKTENIFNNNFDLLYVNWFLQGNIPSKCQCLCYA